MAQYKATTKAKTKVYTKTSTTSVVLRTLNKKTSITVEDASGKWYKIVNGSGYIFSGDVTVKKLASSGLVIESETTKTVKYKVTVSQIWTYNKANDPNSRVGLIYKDAIVSIKVTTIKDAAGNVEVKNGSGWVKIDSVEGNKLDPVKNKYIDLTLGFEKIATTNKSKVTKEDKKKKAEDENTVIIEETTVQQYGSYLTAEQYKANLEEGLRIRDFRGIFGMPHQFLPTTDPRIDGTLSNDGIGNKYLEKIINPMPLLMITPGSPEFMSSYNTKQKNLMLQQYVGRGITKGDITSLVDQKNGKFYSLKFDYTNYFYYVNAMLRSAAYFLGIQNETIDDSNTLGTMNYLYRNINAGDDIHTNNNLSKYLGTYVGAIPFYVDTDTSIDDSFSNQTSNPSIADTINGVSDQAREMNFLLGTVSGAAGGVLDSFVSTDGLSDSLEQVTKGVDKILGSNNIFTTLTQHASTILSGGKMVFPEIWTDSSFSRDYNIKMKFISPSGDKLSIFLNILSPIFHLLALVLPRQSAAQAYYSPFLVRAWYKGLFNVDMGIITSMSISKGAEGEWTDDGLPTVAEVSFTIKDLYNGMFMSTAMDFNDMNIMSNITELDYIANSCGININEPEVRRTVEMYMALNFTTRATDSVTIGVFGEFTQWANQKFQNIFGKF